MVSLTEQLDEAKRELGQKKRLYPLWIAKGTLPQATADRRLAAQEAIVETLAGLVATASGQLTLLTMNKDAATQRTEERERQQRGDHVLF